MISFQAIPNLKTTQPKEKKQPAFTGEVVPPTPGNAAIKPQLTKDVVRFSGPLTGDR